MSLCARQAQLAFGQVGYADAAEEVRLPPTATLPAGRRSRKRHIHRGFAKQSKGELPESSLAMTMLRLISFGSIAKAWPPWGPRRLLAEPEPVEGRHQLVQIGFGYPLPRGDLASVQGQLNQSSYPVIYFHGDFHQTLRTRGLYISAVSFPRLCSWASPRPPVYNSRWRSKLNALASKLLRPARVGLPNVVRR